MRWREILTDILVFSYSKAWMQKNPTRVRVSQDPKTKPSKWTLPTRLLPNLQEKFGYNEGQGQGALGTMISAVPVVRTAGLGTLSDPRQPS